MTDNWAQGLDVEIEEICEISKEKEEDIEESLYFPF